MLRVGAQQPRRQGEGRRGGGDVVGVGSGEAGAEVGLERAVGGDLGLLGLLLRGGHGAGGPGDAVLFGENEVEVSRRALTEAATGRETQQARRDGKRWQEMTGDSRRQQGELTLAMRELDGAWGVLDVA